MNEKYQDKLPQFTIIIVPKKSHHFMVPQLAPDNENSVIKIESSVS
jgi:hypothetical protein